jgi:hypothetical protein
VIVLQKDPRPIVKRKDAQSDVIIYLVEKGPANMYQIGKQTGLYYSSVHKVINTFLMTGIAQPENNSISEKNIETKSYGLTFKGVLKYLSTFKIYPDPLTEIPKKDAEDYYEKFCEKHGKNLLNILERQGKKLNYVPFQEIRWLSEHHPRIIKLFINQAKNHLNPSLNSTGQFADTLSKNLSNPDLHLGVDDLRELRGAENSFLKDAFGKTFLLNMAYRNKKDSENEKLKLFAERILKENKVEIALLEQAASSF